MRNLLDELSGHEELVRDPNMQSRQYGQYLLNLTG